jgi:hypothetical protein
MGSSGPSIPLFETGGMNKGWAGTFKSSSQEMGVYTWIIHMM